MNDILADKGPLLHAATRAWQRLPVVAHDVLGPGGVPTGALRFDPPQGGELAVDAAPGELVLIPQSGLWNVALVLAADPEQPGHVVVAYVPRERQAAQFTGGPYPAEPVVFPVQRDNCYRTRRAD